MQLALDVIDGFRAIARTTANKLYWVPASCSYRQGGQNKFAIHALNANLPTYRLTEDALICYCGNEGARIIFKDIMPKKITALEVGEPISFNEHVTSTEVQKWRNAGKTVIDRSYEDVTEHRRLEMMDISAEIGMLIETKISGGYAGIQAELKAQLSAKFGIEHKTEDEVKQSEKELLDFKIPRWTETSLIKKESISDVRQTVKMKCLLDASVSFDSNDDWGKHFESLASMELYLKGGGGGKDDSAWNLNTFVATRKFEDFVLDLSFLEVEIEKERIYRDVRTSDVERVDTRITHGRGKRKNE